MDEVDGVGGNEDRGGIQELINVIKSASVPFICICNDRMVSYVHIKVVTLRGMSPCARKESQKLMPFYSGVS